MSMVMANALRVSPFREPLASAHVCTLGESCRFAGRAPFFH